MTGKVIHIIDDVVAMEHEADFDERFEVEVTEEYDLNHHLHYRAKIKIREDCLDEIDVEKVLGAIRKFEGEGGGSVAEFIDVLIGIACDIVDDPSFDLSVRYVGGDFPRYDITFVVF